MLPQAILDHFHCGFYVHVQSIPFMKDKSDSSRPSQVLRHYSGFPGDRTVVELCWHELISLGVANEEQVRRMLKLKFPKPLPQRMQHFISATGLYHMLMRCKRAIAYYQNLEIGHRSNVLLARMQFNFRYNSLAQARDSLIVNGFLQEADSFEVSKKASRRKDGRAVIDYVDRLGLAYATNNSEFLEHVSQQIETYGKRLRTCLADAVSTEILQLRTENEDRRILMSPVANHRQSISNGSLTTAQTITEAVQCLNQMKQLTKDVLGFDALDVLIKDTLRGVSRSDEPRHNRVLIHARYAL